MGARGGGSPLWIFGYGSLLWRPDFPHEETRPVWAVGWSRRFWQASPDHRGVPDSPGRVVTLVREAGAACWGLIFRVSPGREVAALRALDERESGGFARTEIEVRAGREEGAVALAALTYVAGPGNANFLGPAPLASMLTQVRSARGRSGSNADYVRRLARCLRTHGAQDEHVFALASGIDGNPEEPAA